RRHNHLCFFSYSYTHTLSLLSFPTRRSSDLVSGWTASSLAPRLAWVSPRSRQCCTDWPALKALECSSECCGPARCCRRSRMARGDRKSTRLNSSHVKISYAVFCLKKKNDKQL